MNWPEEDYTDILAKLNEVNNTYELSNDNFHNDEIDIKQVNNKQLGEEHQMLQNEKKLADKIWSLYHHSTHVHLMFSCALLQTPS